ncbi:hypothetical protein BOX15_Mlig024399g1 [Macrostomum lignano]|uniref:Caveolin n=1 Tax=Macrostomum lignano TaxID=282301 RepID=A0A267GQL3_9PLAT|nr:hypothetical protein BOX15_Mlig024399g1 [Macrostomum lignano]
MHTNFAMNSVGTHPNNMGSNININTNSLHNNPHIAVPEEDYSPDSAQEQPSRFNFKGKSHQQQQPWSKRLVPSVPKVAGNKVRFEQFRADNLDVVSRDPEGLNGHCRVKFEDIIAEPDPTVFSFDGVWVLSYKVFSSTKLWCYRITSLICAIPAAICWGIEFACLSFCTIWCWQPSIKAYEISLWYTRRIFEILLAVFLEPCFNAMGKCLSHIVVTVKREG